MTPGYKYNMTDIAAAMGLSQLARAEQMRRAARVDRRSVSRERSRAWTRSSCRRTTPNRIHSWHLFPILLQARPLAVERDAVIDVMRQEGIGFSVHWRPLHLHPYYRGRFGWQASQCPVASRVWETLISLPIFPDMTSADVDRVVAVVKSACANRRRSEKQPVRRQNVPPALVHQPVQS